MPEALKRCRVRVDQLSERRRVRIACLVADLDVPGGNVIPLRSSIYDAALLSLVISYVRRPADVLADVYRVLCPGGRIVLSSLRRDADISKLHQEGLLELEEGRAAEILGLEGAQSVVAFARDFLNDAARILDLEEGGRFRFWDAPELRALVRGAGFIHVRSVYRLGDPPQATIVIGEKPIIAVHCILQFATNIMLKVNGKLPFVQTSASLKKGLSNYSLKTISDESLMGGVFFVTSHFQ